MIKRLHKDKEKEYGDDVFIINDVDELCFEEGDPANDLKMGDTNVSQLFRQYQNESLIWRKCNFAFFVMY